MKFNTKLRDELVKSERYRLNCKKLNTSKLVKKAFSLINELGFCVLDNVVNKDLNSIKSEIRAAQVQISKNHNKYKDYKKKNINLTRLLKKKDIQIRRTKFNDKVYKLVNDIYWLPKFSKYLADHKITDIFKLLLDDHIRISQIHLKCNNYKAKIKIKKSYEFDQFGLPRIRSSNKNLREWHTDWPHDLWAYGGKNPKENIGCIRDPFPDVIMGLVVIHLFTDTNDQQGTWVIPGSHKFGTSPRNGKIALTSKLPGEMQINANAGSVFFQDTRLWHSSSMLSSKVERISVVSRWYPWWLQINDFATESIFNVVNRPLSKTDFQRLPKKLKPFMIHLCNDISETIQKPILTRSQKYIKDSYKFYKNLAKKK